MNVERPDLLPRWQPPSAASEAPSRGLFQELLEAGILVKDLVVPDHTYRVTTRIHCDLQTCFFRCAVSADGVEFEGRPWGPQFCDLAIEIADRGPDGQSALARRALEAHLATCTRAGRALERKGRLVSQTGAGMRWGLAAAVGAALILGGAAAWWSLRSGEPTGTDAAASPVASGSLNGGLAGDDAQKVSADAESTTEAAGVEASVGVPQPAEIAPREATVPQSGSPPRQNSLSPSAPKQSASDVASVARVLPAPPDAEPRRPTPGAPVSPTASDVSPADHSVVVLEAGGRIYFRDRLQLLDVPRWYQGLRCFTTREAAGDTDQGISFSLSAAARVVVLFDREVEKRPDWLSGFHPSGEVVTAVDPERAGKVRTFLILHRDYSAGVVSLGTNTAAYQLTKRLRMLVRRNTLMYVVCPSPLSSSSTILSAPAVPR